MENQLINLYGCSLTKKGNKLKITLISGDKPNIVYYNALIKEGNEKFKYSLSKDKKSYLIKLPILQYNKKETSTKDEDFESIENSK